MRFGDIGEASTAGASFMIGGDRCAREALGSWIPRDGSDNDLRRVLYGILS